MAASSTNRHHDCSRRPSANLPMRCEQGAVQERVAPPFHPSAFRATAALTAGETIPHTAPWEIGAEDETDEGFGGDGGL